MAKYKVSLLQRPLCPDTNDTDFIANLEQVIEILKGIDETVPNPQSSSGKVLMMSWDLAQVIGDWRRNPPTENISG